MVSHGLLDQGAGEGRYVVELVEITLFVLLNKINRSIARSIDCLYNVCAGLTTYYPSFSTLFGNSVHPKESNSVRVNIVRPYDFCPLCTVLQKALHFVLLSVRAENVCAQVFEATQCLLCARQQRERS